MRDRPVEYLKGIGPARASLLRDEAGIETVEDLLYYLPRRYIDRSTFRQIRDCFVNEVVTVGGTITSVQMSGGRRRFLEVIIDDGTDTLSGVFFGGVRYFRSIFKDGDFVIFSGKINFYNSKQIVHPDFDFIESQSQSRLLNTGRIIPLYRSTEKLKGAGLDSRGFRRIIRTALDTCLDTVVESLDPGLLARNGLISIRDAISGIHFPDSFEHAEKARKRLSFNEVFFLQYYLSLSRRLLRESYPGRIKSPDTRMLDDFLKGLPFELTPDQESAISGIMKDMTMPSPMNRLLQGDVGSGKTVVAMAASLIAAGSGMQVAVMAPTEVLAFQHFASFRELLPPGTEIEIITGSTPRPERDRILSMMTGGDADIVIGTHCLIQSDVTFSNLGLIIIDEQHRFGVNQRADLRTKGRDADLLVLTATPIPRSLSLTLYGDLDITTIRTRPLNRIPVKTLSFPESRLRSVYNSINKYVSQGRQVYYVLPMIEESEKTDLKSAISVHRNLQERVFPDMRVELLHGKMKQSEKDSIMAGFRNGDTDILVTTTVIEVGIDVPNATVIIIEHAERFGLSQLHQLRGRVGRGAHQSFCVLIHPDGISGDSMKRIQTLLETDDGFIISEEDLKLRGAGELIGVRQHGRAGSFEFVSLADDLDLILSARQEAGREVERLNNASSVLEDLRNSRYESLIEGIRKKRILAILS